jgi:hypothetical protein
MSACSRNTRLPAERFALGICGRITGRWLGLLADATNNGNIVTANMATIDDNLRSLIINTIRVNINS